jgi:hypothetical protein
MGDPVLRALVLKAVTKYPSIVDVSLDGHGVFLDLVDDLEDLDDLCDAVEARVAAVKDEQRVLCSLVWLGSVAT